MAEIQVTDEMVEAFYRADVTFRRAELEWRGLNGLNLQALNEGAFRKGLVAVLAIVERDSKMVAVAGLHQEFEGRCVECVEWCECQDRDACEHGNVRWPCPTAKAGGFA